MPRQRVIIITIGLMLSLFMASLESTVVATAMPTIVSQLGGLSSYSWVFAVYMLTSTTSVPLYGKLSDLYGRRPIYAIAMGLFLVGSLLCGLAQSMNQLIAARAVQGLGAGGLMPLAFIIIGDLFTFEQRARMQGVFSGVWGVSSVLGPLLGGFLVDQISWHWVFYANIIPVLIALALIWRSWQDRPRPANAARPNVDYAGAALLTAGVVALLLGLGDMRDPLGWAALGAAALLLGLLMVVERRVPDPVLPLGLFRERMFAVACAHGVLAGCAMFGSASFVPLYVQAVVGTSATAAGATLTPMMLAWVASSIVGSRLLLRMGYRTLALVGMVLVTLGALGLTQVSGSAATTILIASMALMGVGMGLSIPSFLIAVQSSVQREKLGTATSTLQFSRSIGGTLGVSLMGALLSARLSSGLLAAGLDPASVSLNQLLDPIARAGASIDAAVQSVLANAIQGVFWIALGSAALGLLVTTLAPAGRVGQLASQRQQADSELAAPLGGASD